MIRFDAVDKFWSFLNEIKSGQKISDCGLVPEAPPEAIEQYEEYKQMVKEANESDINIF